VLDRSEMPDENVISLNWNQLMEANLLVILVCTLE